MCQRHRPPAASDADGSKASSRKLKNKSSILQQNVHNLLTHLHAVTQQCWEAHEMLGNMCLADLLGRVMAGCG